jgi:hypothetical protein
VLFPPPLKILPLVRATLSSASSATTPIFAVNSACDRGELDHIERELKGSLL